MSPDLLVEAHDIAVDLGGRRIIDRVSLIVRRGEIVTLIGPNGGGKSTVAKALLGVIPVSEGQLSREKNLKIGYVPQKLTIDWSMPLKVERFMRLMHPHAPAEIAYALHRTGAGHLMHAPMQGLSGGEFQRVLIARAIIGKPDLLVLDEPVQGVDHRGEIALYDLIRSIRADLNCGVLLISHDLHVVMADSDTIVCLNGHVCCSGSPEAVQNSASYVELFGERAIGTLAVYRHHHDHDHDHKHGPHCTHDHKEDAPHAR